MSESKNPEGGKAKREQQLSRRTRTLDGSLRKLYPENSFWTQAQNILIPAIQKEEYDNQFYIDVPLSEGHVQSEEIEKYLAMPNEPRCLLLVGPPGVGKSSLVHHYYHVTIAPAAHAWAWIHLDGNEHRARLANDISQLIPCLLAVCFKSLDSFLQHRGLTKKDFLLDIFEQDIGLATERFLESDAPVEEKLKIVKRHLEQKQSVNLEATLRYFSRSVAVGKAVLVLDNLDPLGPEVQAEAVRQVLALAVSSKIKSIVAIRKKAEASLSYSDRDLFSQFIRTPVQHPSLVEVLRRRVAVAVQHHDAQNAKLGEGALQFKVRDCPEFVNLLVKGLSADGLQRIIEGVSNGSVRQGLRISLAIYGSPYLDAKRIVARLSPAGQVIRDLWRDSIPNHIAVRSMLLRTSRVYDEEIAWVKNIFGSNTSNTHIGPFLRLQIVRFLRALAADEVSEGDCARELAGVLLLDNALVKKEIRWLASKEWIEVTSSGAISVTSLGDFIVQEFVFHRDYLSCISADVDMYSDFERRLISLPSSFAEHIHNVGVLLEYLALRELKMLRLISERGLRAYCKWFGGEGFTPEILDRVLANIELIRLESAADSAKARLKALAEGSIIKDIQEVLRRFGAED